jgi:hypothetical protein
MLDRCWPLIRGGAGLAEVVDALLLDGFRSVDNFVLMHQGDGHYQLIVRGSGIATLHTGEEVRADGVSTWVERRFVGSGVDIRLAGGESGATACLPLVSGAVLAGEIVVRSADPQPAIEPVDTPAVQSMVGDRTESLAQLQAAMGVRTAPDEQHDYDFLFGATRRPPSAPHGPVPPVPTRLMPGPAAGQASVAQPVWPSPIPDPQPQPATGGLIDSVPWAPSAVRPPTGPADDGATGMARTVNRAHLPAATVAHRPPPVPGPTVHAVRCPNQHLSPPHAASCRVCGAPVVSQPAVVVPRPVLGVLRLSTGDRIPLDRGVVMGRAPSPVDDTDPDRPHVLRLASPADDISRVHLEVRLEDWNVLVVDLGSTNGTVVTAPGQEPERLRANDPQVIEAGTVVSLADEITFRFEVTG